MSKMKYLLRKLHIGGGINDHHRLGETRPVDDPSPSSSNLPSSSSSNGRIGLVESAVADRTAGDENSSADFNYMEEEFQVQLALALSASYPASRQDPESAQIDAAKRISLGCSLAPVTETNALVESLSLRYWSYNVVNYNEKVTDGFYDVYGITSNSIVQGKMPLLVDLQAISVSDNVDYEVIFVNHLVDPELRELEKRAYIMSLENQLSNGLLLSGLVQKLADIVVDRMGGPVADADVMSRSWTKRSYELQNALNSIILPLGRLDIGLSRHRALLFKVLADRINLPCMLVKGSYYTGTDDGAVNLIKTDNGSEFIVDLMGAPGTLIPAEVPSSHLSISGFDERNFSGHTETQSLSLSLGEGPGALFVSPNHDLVPQLGSLGLEEALFAGHKTNGANPVNQTEQSEHEFAKLHPSSYKSYETSFGSGKPSSTQQINVKNVSEYVINAAKDPEFAQKLHAVLLESGASPPPNLFVDINQQDLDDQKVFEQVRVANGRHLDDTLHCCSNKLLPRHGHCLLSLTGEYSLDNLSGENEQKGSAERLAEQHREFEATVLKSEVPLPSDTTSEEYELVAKRSSKKLQIDAADVAMVPISLPGMLRMAMHETQIDASSLSSGMNHCQLNPEDVIVTDDKKMGRIFNMESKEYAVKLNETANLIASGDHSERINPVLGEVAEWEIPWEDLQIGERIGIGSYGEVYHADWNGTEVAVKKFLDQDFSGDALVQFKYEAELMLRLRHPNVVLFMGAVARPPNLSILTEYLPRGSLYKLLHRSNPQPDEKRRMRMALDVAKGMNYLHTSHPTIVHRDLKSPNLLVDKNWVVKVCDFGMSRMKPHTFLSSKSTAGTPEWMAPEVLRNEPANEKCDVFSFGVILWELATCQIPWKGLNPMQVVGAVGFQNRRLEISENVDPAIAQIIHECWQTEPHLRPSFSQLILRLRCIQHLHVERRNCTNQTE